MPWNDVPYFRERAAIERALARTAANPKAKAAHNEMAQRYEALVGQGRRPTLVIAGMDSSPTPPITPDAEQMIRKA